MNDRQTDRWRDRQTERQTGWREVKCSFVGLPHKTLDYDFQLDSVCSLLHNSAVCVRVCGAKVEGNRLLIELELKMESKL